MTETEIYNIIRAEIIANHVLMHLFTMFVVIILLTGIVIVEKGKTVLSVFLPLLSLAWAAGIVRFDYFIQRQGAFLRVLEARMIEKNGSMPLWETWKATLGSTAFIVPLMDILAVGIIVIPTFYLLFGPAADYFASKNIRGGKIYAWSVSLILILLLLFLAVIPVLLK